MSTRLYEGDVVLALKTIGEITRKGQFYVVRDTNCDGKNANLAHDDLTKTAFPLYISSDSFQRLGTPLDFKQGSRWMTRDHQCVFFKEACRAEHNGEIYSKFTDKSGSVLNYWPTLKTVSKQRTADIMFPYDGLGSFLSRPPQPLVPAVPEPAKPVEPTNAPGYCDYCSTQYRYRVVHADVCQFTHLEALMGPVVKTMFRRNAQAKEDAQAAARERTIALNMLGTLERAFSQLNPKPKKEGLGSAVVDEYERLTGVSK